MALLPEHVDARPLGCHNPRIADRTVFERVIGWRWSTAPATSALRSHAWMNGFGKLRRCTEKRSRVVDFHLYLSAAIVTLRMLIRRATPRYRRDGRPTTRRLK